MDTTKCPHCGGEINAAALLGSRKKTMTEAAVKARQGNAKKRWKNQGKGIKAGGGVMIYLVTSGCYSDYRVIAAFSSKAKAEEFIAAVPAGRWDDYNDVEEFELDPPAVSMLAHGYFLWLLKMNRDGDVTYIEQPELEGHEVSGVGKDVIGGNTMITRVWAKDREHAIKIANERRAQIIALGQWG